MVKMGNTNMLLKLLAALGQFLVVSGSQARDLEPHYYYVVSGGGCLAQACTSSFYPTSDAAYSVYKSEMAGHGMAFLDLFPAPGTAIYNGKPATYYWNYRFTDSNDDVIHNTGSINMMPECDIALEQKMIRIGESNPPTYRISCLKPDEV